MTTNKPEAKKVLTEEEVSKLGPQDKLVYDYLITGRALTNMVGLVNLGVGSLSRRISTLRSVGLDVAWEWGKDHFGSRYKKYFVKPAEDEEKKDA